MNLKKWGESWNLWDNFKHFNIWIRGARRRRGRTKNWKLIWTNNEGKLPQSGKGNRLPGSPGNSESPKKVGFKEAHTKAHHITLAKIKEKERILEASREKDTVTYKGLPIRLSADLSKETLQARRGWRSIPSQERQGLSSQIALSSKAFIWNGSADKVLTR